MKKAIQYITTDNNGVNSNWQYWGLDQLDSAVQTAWDALSPTFVIGSIAVFTAQLVRGTLNEAEDGLSDVSILSGPSSRDADWPTGNALLANLPPGSAVDAATGIVGPFIGSKTITAPAAASATAVHNAVALTAATQHITTGITSPVTPRSVTIVGNAVGIAGNITVNGSYQGVAIAEVIALNGTTSVESVNVFDTVTSLDLPIQTHVGTDTVSIGTGTKFPIGYKLTNNTVLMVLLDGVQVAVSAQTVAVSSTLLPRNTILFATAPNAAHSYVVYYINR